MLGVDPPPEDGGGAMHNPVNAGKNSSYALERC